MEELSEAVGGKGRYLPWCDVIALMQIRLRLVGKCCRGGARGQGANDGRSAAEAFLHGAAVAEDMRGSKASTGGEKTVRAGKTTTMWKKWQGAALVVWNSVRRSEV